MKKVIKFGGFLIAFFCIMSTANAQKFGYVNSTEVLADHPKVKQADSQLEVLQKQLQKKLEAEVAKFQTEYKALAEKAAKGELSPLEQDTKGKELEAKQRALAQSEQESAKQLQDKRAELLQPIYDSVNTAIETVAKEEGLQFVFDAAVLLYAAPGQDITAKVKAKL